MILFSSQDGATLPPVKPGQTMLRARHVVGLSRRLSSVSAVFDASTKARQKARAARAPNAADFDYLRDEVATRVVDRLADVSRPAARALDLGCGGGAHFLRALISAENPARVEELIHADVHADVLARAETFYDGVVATPGRQFVFREDRELPIEKGSLDLVVSAGSLQWVNDLPGVLARVCNLLRPDGLFLGAMFGGDTLQELRISLQLADEEVRGGVAPRVSPMVHMRDVGSVLGRAGLVLTTIDLDRLVVPFTDMHALMRHLRGMGETNAALNREAHCGRRTFERAACIYKERFGFVDEQGRECIPATFQIMHMIGWSPSESQQKPMERGSAQFSIADLPSIASETVRPSETS